jgi:hypothetical protein
MVPTVLVLWWLRWLRTMRDKPRSASLATTPSAVTPLLLSSTLRAFCGGYVGCSRGRRVRLVGVTCEGLDWQTHSGGASDFFTSRHTRVIHCPLSKADPRDTTYNTQRATCHHSPLCMTPMRQGTTPTPSCSATAEVNTITAPHALIPLSPGPRAPRSCMTPRTSP